MARIAGVDIPTEKRVEIALTYIKGIGRRLAKQILQEAGILPDVRVKDLSEKDISRIREVIEKREYRVEGELSQEVAL
ncbi:30S ribosomal protein S13, partial [Candidatus Saccharibacteria bacterium]|nr:30S ribosomal protein S13 [Candidatus Saccharibacteria bacterium]